jgi:hypothetical protein
MPDFIARRRGCRNNRRDEQKNKAEPRKSGCPINDSAPICLRFIICSIGKLHRPRRITLTNDVWFNPIGMCSMSDISERMLKDELNA